MKESLHELNGSEPPKQSSVELPVVACETVGNEENSHRNNRQQNGQKVGVYDLLGLPADIGRSNPSVSDRVLPHRP